MEFHYGPSELLDHMVPERERKFSTSTFRRSRKGNAAVSLNGLSFTHNPRKTMDLLGVLGDRECDSFGIYLDFHDDYCLDVGPYLLLSVMKRQMSPMFLGGEISMPMSKVLHALGLDQELGITVPLSDDRHEDVFPFPVHRRRASGESTSETRFIDQQSHEKVAQNLNAAIDEWLSITSSQRLNPRGRRIVLRLVAETLDNAERHGDLERAENDGDWIVAGFMARRENDGREYYRCHLAFLSTGTTIEESIATAPEPIATKMAEYVDRHKGAVGSRRHASKHLRTVFALQDGVTRSEEATLEKRNGTGLQDILEFYSDLAGDGAEISNASMAIVSGITCVLCNGAYMHGRKMEGEDSERELWFNATNSQADPPDASNVIELERCLKGTLITMAFTLDLDYLERTVDRAN